MPQMLNRTGQTNAAQPSCTGLAPGTEVMTMAGTRPVEKLVAGDRIVTRAGACAVWRGRRMTGFD